MTDEETSIKILEVPPPSEETGYMLVYSKDTGYRGSDFNKKASKTEKLGLKDLFTTPGLNIVVISLLSGIVVLVYMIYLLFS